MPDFQKPRNSSTARRAVVAAQRGWREFNLSPGAWLDDRIIRVIDARDERRRRLQ